MVRTGASCGSSDEYVTTCACHRVEAIAKEERAPVCLILSDKVALALCLIPSGKAKAQTFSERDLQ